MPKRGNLFFLPMNLILMLIVILIFAVAWERRSPCQAEVRPRLVGKRFKGQCANSFEEISPGGEVNTYMTFLILGFKFNQAPAKSNPCQNCYPWASV